MPAARRGMETHMNRNSSNLRNRRKAQPNGFTLMELLIVMSIVVVLTLLAIPTVGAYRKSVNKISALKSIQAIQMAESMYQQNYGRSGIPARCRLWAVIRVQARRLRRRPSF